MHQQLDEALKSIKTLEEEKAMIENKIVEYRKSVFDVLEKESLSQYKTDVATVSYVERRTVKYQDRDQIMSKLLDMNLIKYIETIPERKEINAQFEKDVKEGAFQIEGVDVEVKALPQIRFSK